MIGAVLAGGAGRRLAAGRGHGAPASKAAARLAGRPLVTYPLATLGRVCGRVAVVCKRDTALPAVGGVERWDEPDEPRHPVAGIVHALERAGEAVLVCAVDMPFVTEEDCRGLIAAAGEIAATPRSVVAVGERGLEPLLGVYALEDLPLLRRAPAEAPLRATVAALDPVRVELSAAVLKSVNTSEDLAAAEAALSAGRVAR